MIACLGSSHSGERGDEGRDYVPRTAVPVRWAVHGDSDDPGRDWQPASKSAATKKDYKKNSQADQTSP